jgi:predicted transcriptional regulator
MKNKIVTVKLEPQITEQLQSLGKAKDRSPHWLMKQAINEYIKREKHKESLRQETLTRWQEAEHDELFSQEQVSKWLDNWENQEKP